MVSLELGLIHLAFKFFLVELGLSHHLTLSPLVLNLLLELFSGALDLGPEGIAGRHHVLLRLLWAEIGLIVLSLNSISLSTNFSLTDIRRLLMNAVLPFPPSGF